jgi:hypothetical protein
MLGLGLAGILLALRRRSDPLRPAALAAGAITVIVLAYYVLATRRTDFTGEAFGARHLLAITPLAYFFAAVFLSRHRHVFITVLAALFVAIGIFYSTLGAVNPWYRVERWHHPPVRMLQRLVVYPWSSYPR